MAFDGVALSSRYSVTRVVSLAAPFLVASMVLEARVSTEVLRVVMVLSPK
jgi:hypothetical protein